MGDRCTVFFEIHSTDKEQLLSALEKASGRREEPDEELVSENLCITQLCFYECNYAWDSQIAALAKEPSCPLFVGRHTEGGDYGSMLFAKDGVDVLYVDSSWDCFPVIRVINGVPDADELDIVRRFNKLEKDFYNVSTEAATQEVKEG